MTTAEITAYLLGAECARQGLSITQAFLRGSWKPHSGLCLDLDAARDRLGNDTFAHWMRRGYDEVSQWRD